jgi:signal transduction histidine kinase
MDFRRLSPGRFAFGVALRAIAIGALGSLAVQLIRTTQLYATVLVITAIVVILAADLAHSVGRLLRQSEREAGRLAGRRDAHQFEHQAQLELLQTLLDTLAAAVIILETDGRITLANRAARHLAVTTPVSLGDAVALGQGAARHLLTLQPGAREIVTIADGRRLFASVAQFSVPGRGPRRLIALQPIVGELDAIEHRAWQDMAHVLAHEMMNSLTPIASLSESLEALLQSGGGAQASRASLEAEVAAALEAIKRRSRGLMSFVARYREVADLPAPRPERVMLRPLLRGIESLLHPAFVARQIEYRAYIEPEELSVDADPQLLEQAVINLLRNATDAVAEAEVRRIEVRCRANLECVVIEIADSGCGIPEAKREQVFVPFFTTKPGGSGIGLSLARQVALSHRGRLELDANHPHGSVFRLLLPLAASPPVGSAAEIAHGGAQDHEPQGQRRDDVEPEAHHYDVEGAMHRAVQGTEGHEDPGPGDIHGVHLSH